MERLHSYPEFAAVKFDGDRIPLPARFAEAGHFAGDAPIECWLLVITAGRYRLLVKPDSQAASMNNFFRILQEREKLGAPADVLDSVQNNAQSAIAARLIPTTASRLAKAWRVIIPKEAKMLAPTGGQEEFVFVIMVAGFVEFWFPETLRLAVSKPIPELLP